MSTPAKLQFEEGEVARVSVRFANNGVAVSPSEKKLEVHPPGGVTYEVSADEIHPVERGGAEVTGEFYADITFTAPGMWKWRWEGSGDITAVARGRQWVEARNI